MAGRDISGLPFRDNEAVRAWNYRIEISEALVEKVLRRTFNGPPKPLQFLDKLGLDRLYAIPFPNRIDRKFAAPWRPVALPHRLVDCGPRFGPMGGACI